MIHAEANGAGPIAWRMRGEGEDLLVLMNTAGHPARAAKTVEFTLPAAALGHPETLEGARVYLNTWDYGEGLNC